MVSFHSATPQYVTVRIIDPLHRRYFQDEEKKSEDTSSSDSSSPSDGSSPVDTAKSDSDKDYGQSNPADKDMYTTRS